MKHLTVISIIYLSFCSSSAAQITLQEYPFPYNPDSNQDGMVSMTDFLEILGVFGQEYPNSFYADSTTAVLELGEMDATTCLAHAQATDHNWRMVTTKDAFYHSHLMAEASANNDSWGYNGSYSYRFYCCWSRDTQTATQLRIDRNPSLVWDESYFYVSEEDSSMAFRLSVSLPYDDNEAYVQGSRHCMLITEVQPIIEYIECLSPECISQKLNDGWLPLGASGYGGFGFLRESD